MSARDPLVDVPVRDLGPGGQIVARIVTFRTVKDKLTELRRLIVEAVEGDPIVRGVAARVGSTPEALQRFVQQWISYEDEREENLETPRLTLLRRTGDCDAQVVLLGALALASGYAFAFGPMGGTEDDPQHVAGAIGWEGSLEGIPWHPFEARPTLGSFTWTETIIPAHFGEHPHDAAIRLGRTPGRAS